MTGAIIDGDDVVDPDGGGNNVIAYYNPIDKTSAHIEACSNAILASHGKNTLHCSALGRSSVVDEGPIFRGIIDAVIRDYASNIKKTTDYLQMGSYIDNIPLLQTQLNGILQAQLLIRTMDEESRKQGIDRAGHLPLIIIDTVLLEIQNRIQSFSELLRKSRDGTPIELSYGGPTITELQRDFGIHFQGFTIIQSAITNLISKGIHIDVGCINTVKRTDSLMHYINMELALRDAEQTQRPEKYDILLETRTKTENHGVKTKYFYPRISQLKQHLIAKREIEYTPEYWEMQYLLSLASNISGTHNTEVQTPNIGNIPSYAQAQYPILDASGIVYQSGNDTTAKIIPITRYQKLGSPVMSEIPGSLTALVDTTLGQIGKVIGNGSTSHSMAAFPKNEAGGDFQQAA